MAFSLSFSVFPTPRSPFSQVMHTMRLQAISEWDNSTSTVQFRYMCVSQSGITCLKGSVGQFLDFLHHDCQPHRVTSGRITRSQLLHTKLKHESLSASDCRLEGLGFESHQSHVWFFSPGLVLPRAGRAMGPKRRLEPHSWASSTSQMHL